MRRRLLEVELDGVVTRASCADVVDDNLLELLECEYNFAPTSKWQSRVSRVQPTALGERRVRRRTDSLPRAGGR